jgi:hypothetical protein
MLSLESVGENCVINLLGIQYETQEAHCLLIEKRVDDTG